MLNWGVVRPGDVVTVVGAGPIGLAVMMGARLFSPSHVIAIDLADSRLDAAKQFGADVVVNNGREDAPRGDSWADRRPRGRRHGRGCPRRAGDVRAGRGVGSGLAATSPTSACTANRQLLHLEELWIKNVTITTGLVDTYSTPTLLRLAQSQQVDVDRFVTHHFLLDQFEEAYDVFSRAGETGALKVVLTRS